MDKQPMAVQFQLPVWVAEYVEGYQPTTDLSQRMQFVVEASRRNVEAETGGPFAAAIFEQESGALVALGVNLVTTEELSILHAEMVAIALAQRTLNHYDLSAEGLPALELVTSTEPCAMCLGAIPWSGVRHVVTGALGMDAEVVGFDEGTKPADWVAALEARGITVACEVERPSAREVLRYYQQQGGALYNARGG